MLEALHPFISRQFVKKSLSFIRVVGHGELLQTLGLLQPLQDPHPRIDQ